MNGDRSPPLLLLLFDTEGEGSPRGRGLGTGACTGRCSGEVQAQKAEVPGLGGPASCGVGGCGSKLLLGLLMSPSPVRARSASGAPSRAPPAPPCPPGGFEAAGRLSLSAELGLEVGLPPGCSVAPGGRRRKAGRTRSSFLSRPRWSSARLL